MMEHRVIRSKDKVKREVELLFKVVGFSTRFGMLILENPQDGSLEGRYLSTGAVVKLTDNKIRVKDWGREDGKQVEVTKSITSFVRPINYPMSHHVRESCGCGDCKAWREWFEGG